jgi:hypothetical protein
MRKALVYKLEGTQRVIASQWITGASNSNHGDLWT